MRKGKNKVTPRRKKLRLKRLISMNEYTQVQQHGQERPSQETGKTQFKEDTILMFVMYALDKALVLNKFAFVEEYNF